MAPPKKPWFRFYVEAIDDDKLVRHPPEICWLWTTIMALARKSVTPGALLISEGTPHTVETISGKSRVAAKKVRQALDEFQKDGMIVRDDSLGCWVVLNFKRRQFESDNVAQRTAKHRSKEQQWNVPLSDNGTGAPLLTENREQNSEAAAATSDTHEEPPEPAAAALIDQSLTVLAERRLAANTSITNPGGYRRSVIEGLRRDHAERIQSLLDGTIGLADWSTEAIADWIEPPHRPPPEPARSYDREPLGCDQCDAGFNEIQPGTVAPCPNCHPIAQAALR